MTKKQTNTCEVMQTLLCMSLNGDGQGFHINCFFIQEIKREIPKWAWTWSWRSVMGTHEADEDEADAAALLSCCWTCGLCLKTGNFHLRLIWNINYWSIQNLSQIIKDFRLINSPSSLINAPRPQSHAYLPLMSIVNPATRLKIRQAQYLPTIKRGCICHLFYPKSVLEFLAYLIFQDRGSIEFWLYAAVI